MTQKYFFSKCGGKNCNFYFPLHDGGIDFICTVDRKESPDCENCPHGKTLEGLSKIIALRGLLSDKYLSRHMNPIKVYEYISFVIEKGLKAFSDGGGI